MSEEPKAIDEKVERSGETDELSEKELESVSGGTGHPVPGGWNRVKNVPDPTTGQVS